MSVATIQERIAARKALGLTSEEYRARIEMNVEMAKANVATAITNCLRNSINGKSVDASHDEYNAAKEQLTKALKDQQAGIIS